MVESMVDCGDDPRNLSAGFQTCGRATLYIYTPHSYQDKYLRPYTYAISENALDKLTSRGTSMAQALSDRSISGSSDIAGAVKPESQGTLIEMQSLEDFWTFVLQIDIESPWLSGSATPVNAVCARRRILYTGVCMDEPISMLSAWTSSPALNENCPIRFTHAMEMTIDPAVNAMGASPRALVRSDVDIVDDSMCLQAVEQDGGCKPLYIATPDKMLDTVDVSAGFTTEGLAALANAKRGVGIVSNLKSPLAHLRSLCMGLDQQIALGEASGSASVAGSMSEVTDIFDVDQFKKGVINEWAQLSAGAGTDAGGINAGNIIPIGELCRLYPDLTVIPQQIARKTHLECLEQGTVDPKTAYSSMVAASVSAIANNFGFSQIIFNYDSVKNQWSGPHGTYSVDSAYLLLPPTDPCAADEMLKNGLELFRRQLFIDLFPAIKAAGCGEFRLHVAYTVNGETYVDLNFYDFPSLGGGFYESANRFANLNSTSIGTGEHFTHQGAILDSVVHKVYGNTMRNSMGATAFGGDRGSIMDAAAPESDGYAY